MHHTYLSPHMDEASNLLEDITVPWQQLPTSYCKLSLNLPLVDKMINLVPSSINLTLPLKSEVKVVDSMSYPPNPTLSSKSVKTEVVTLTQYSSHILVESELKPAEFFVFSSDCSKQGKSYLFQQNPIQSLSSFPFIGVI